MISTYAELKTAISEWTNKTNLSDDKLSDFITMAENDIERDLLLRGVEKSVTGTADASGFITPPADLGRIQAISVAANGAPPYLEYIGPAEAESLSGSLGSKYYWWDNQKIKTLTPATGYTIYYIPKIVPLNNTNTTNYVLTQNANVYLFAALHYASIYLKNITATQGYGQKYIEAVGKMRAESERLRFPLHQPLKIRVRK
jgi:hypothetical protein